MGILVKTSEQEAMDRQNFYRTGPYFLNAVDWNNLHHRRSITASLVQGVYTVERDRQQKRQGPQALASPWWEFFQFKVIQILVDDHDRSYFGAIYEYAPAVYTHNNHVVAYSGLRPPRYVIAFRGTIWNTGNRREDFKLNLHCTINNLHNSLRFRKGLDATRNTANIAGPGNIWLAGHSLGSSIALLIGRHMITDFGIPVETYLFNPPFPAAFLGLIDNQKLTLGLRIGRSILTAALATAVKSDERDRFNKLSTWVPYLFVNKGDLICLGFISHFEHLETMEAMGLGKIGEKAAENSIWNMLARTMGKRDCEAAYLIPCAYLSVHSSSGERLKKAHGLHQWWRSDLMLNYKLISPINTNGVN